MTDTPEIARIRAALEAYDGAGYYDQCEELQDACSTNSIRRVLAHIDAQAAEIARLKRGEFICSRCGIRKDGEQTHTRDF